MTKVIQLAGRYAGQEMEVPFHVAKGCVKSMGGNGTMVLPGEDNRVSVLRPWKGRNAEAPSTQEKPKARKVAKKSVKKS